VNVVRWIKHEGEPVRQGEPLVELETEKVSYELESPAQGVLLKIVAGENIQVPVGDPLCYIGQPGESVCPRPCGGRNEPCQRPRRKNSKKAG
jgi:pyruvate/2-oxoglutarate dehydrogenase complex dihydrolipoamide acyltransferase (E2) component